MNIYLPDSIIKASRKLTKAIMVNASDDKIQQLSEVLCNELVNFIAKDYFNLPTIPEIQCVITKEYDSYFDLETNIAAIGLSHNIPKEKRAAKAIADITHESVHCCQKAFGLSYNQEDNIRSYVTALCVNALHQKSFLYNDHYCSVSPISTYVKNDGTNANTRMYRAQPCEIQANTLMQKIETTLLQQGGISKDIDENMAFHGDTISFKDLSEILSFDYNIVCSMAKIELNIHHGTDYPIEKRVALPYKEYLLSQLSEEEQAIFESYKISSQFPPSNNDDFYMAVINSNDGVDYNQINKDLSHSVEEALLTDVVLSTDANLKHMQLTIAGHQYQAPIKDINEFLFMIGEKRFIDITCHEPERNEDYTIEELEK